MRKALLVVALIGASFAGGAAVNGPGLTWAQGWLTTALRGTAAPPDDEPAPEVTGPPAEAFPAAPLPPLADPATPEPAGAPETPPTAATTTPASPAAVAPATPPTAPPAPLAQVTAPPAPDSPGTPQVPSFEPTPPSDPAASAAAPTGAAAGPEPSWDDAPDSTAPAQAVVPGRSIPKPPSSTAPRTDPVLTKAATPAAAPASPGWAEVRQRMKDLGVSRYWIEGEPGGAARFRCVIPLAGERAVSQQFEAEADDELQAADAALRRVALWRAVAGR